MLRTRVPGCGVVRAGLRKVPRRFHQGSTRFCGLRGRPGWFEVRFYEGFRVPRNSARAVGPEVSQASTKLCKDSTRVPQGSTMFHKGSRNVLQGSVICPGGKQCVVRRRLKSHRIKIGLLMGGTLSKTEINGFFAHFHCFVTYSLAQANVGFVANQITSLRDSRCSRVNAWHCCLVGFGFQDFRLRGL